MRVLITGATGFVGGAVLEQLRRHHEVRALSRHDSPGGAPKGRTVQWLTGDVTRPETLRRALDGMDAVIHLVGIISQTRTVTFNSVHIVGTRNIVRAAKEAGVRRFIHMSAMGTRPRAVSEYHKTKWEAEEIVRNSGLEWTVFRPSLIYGPGDHFINLFANIARYSPALPVIGRATALYAPIHVQVVAEASVSALNKPEAAGKTFELCGPERMTLPEMLRRVLAVTGKRRIILRLPMPFAWVQALALELLYGRLLNAAPPLNRDQLIMLEEGSTGQGGAADELFALNHPGFDEAAGEYVARSNRRT